MALQCVYGCSNKRGESGDAEDGSEISGGVRRRRLPGFLYANDLGLCRESPEGEGGTFCEVCRIRSLEINEYKSKVVVFGRV